MLMHMVMMVHGVDERSLLPEQRVFSRGMRVREQKKNLCLG